jgi:hypothetical protein
MTSVIKEPYSGRCGSSTGYSDHWKLGTEPCAACKRARALHQQDYVKRRYLNGGRGVMVDPIGTRRRLEALFWMGWSYKEIGRRLGMCDTQFRVIAKRKKIYPESAERVRLLFEELCMTPGPSKMCHTLAVRRGYAPPLAWLDIDDPEEISGSGCSGTTPRSSTGAANAGVQLTIHGIL